jgi:RNA polymerase sigma factor (sigma-70 family)
MISSSLIAADRSLHNVCSLASTSLVSDPRKLGALSGHLLDGDALMKERRVHDERRMRFEGLFRSHADAVRGYALRRTDPDDADDVVAETFLIAWRRFDDVPANATPWLLGVARRVLSNRRRSDRRVISLSNRLADRERRKPDAATDDSDLLSTIEVALDRLPEKEREALRLLAWEGLSTGEAAIVLGCTRATLAVRVHRARRRLTDIIEGHLAGADASEPGSWQTSARAEER